MQSKMEDLVEAILSGRSEKTISKLCKGMTNLDRYDPYDRNALTTAAKMG